MLLNPIFYLIKDIDGSIFFAYFKDVYYQKYVFKLLCIKFINWNAKLRSYF